MKKLTFEHRKQFGTNTGAIITMKALVTIHDKQYVECYENNERYSPDELIQVFS